jgi:hypothetical protein
LRLGWPIEVVQKLVRHTYILDRDERIINRYNLSDWTAKERPEEDLRVGQLAGST